MAHTKKGRRRLAAQIGQIAGELNCELDFCSTTSRSSRPRTLRFSNHGLFILLVDTLLRWRKKNIIGTSGRPRITTTPTGPQAVDCQHADGLSAPDTPKA